MSARRQLSVTERLSVVVIVVGIALLALRTLAHDDPPTGPLHSVAQVEAALDAAGVAHHANPADQSVDRSNDCSLIGPKDRGHVRETYRTQLQVTLSSNDDVDLWVVTFDRGGSAQQEEVARKQQAEQNQWLTIVHGNVYAEVEAPVATLPSDLAAKIPAAINGLVPLTDHVPPVLKC